MTRTEAEGGGERTTHHDALGRAVLTYTKGPDVTACDDWGCTAQPRYEQQAHYDHLGRLDRVSLPHLSGDPPGKILYDRYAHDAAGRVTQHTSPWWAITTYAYAGLTTSVTDWTGTASTQADALGRVVEADDADQNATRYDYGPFGALWAVVGADGAVSFTEPDAYGRVRVSVDPDRGATRTDYDGFGEATRSKDARGWSYAFAYDALGRLVQRDDHDGTTTWVYDTAPHGIGRIASVTSPTGNVETYGYDPLSRPSSATLAVEGETFASTFGYDGQSRLQLVAYPQADGVDPLVVRYDHDSSGNVVAVRDNATGTAYWRVDQVDGAGRATVEALANGAITTRHEHDPATGEVTRILTAAGKHKLQDLRYGYDLRARLTSRADGLQPVLGGVLTERFSYDALDRLTCAAVVGGVHAVTPTGAPGCTLSLQYQPSGNIDEKSDMGTYAYDPEHPHAVAGLAGEPPIYGYDAAGDQTQRPGATIDVHGLRPAQGRPLRRGPRAGGRDLRLRRRPAADPQDRGRRGDDLRGRPVRAGDGRRRRREAPLLHRRGERDGGADAGRGGRGRGRVRARRRARVRRRGERPEGGRARAAELRRLRRAEERRGMAGGGAAPRGRRDGARLHRARGGRGARAREHAGEDLRPEGRAVPADGPGRERAALQPELEPVQLRVEQPAGVHGSERVRAPGRVQGRRALLHGRRREVVPRHEVRPRRHKAAGRTR